MSNPSPHLSDDILLGSIDGELSLRQAEDVAAHLEACWGCRAERDRMVSTIRDVVDFRNAIAAGPHSASVRSQFVARLRQRLDHRETVAAIEITWRDRVAGAWSM